MALAPACFNTTHVPSFRFPGRISTAYQTTAKSHRLAGCLQARSAAREMGLVNDLRCGLARSQATASRALLRCDAQMHVFCSVPWGRWPRGTSQGLQLIDTGSGIQAQSIIFWRTCLTISATHRASLYTVANRIARHQQESEPDRHRSCHPCLHARDCRGLAWEGPPVQTTPEDRTLAGPADGMASMGCLLWSAATVPPALSLALCTLFSHSTLFGRGSYFIATDAHSFSIAIFFFSLILGWSRQRGNTVLSGASMYKRP